MKKRINLGIIGTGWPGHTRGSRYRLRRSHRAQGCRPPSQLAEDLLEADLLGFLGDELAVVDVLRDHLSRATLGQSWCRFWSSPRSPTFGDSSRSGHLGALPRRPSGGRPRDRAGCPGRLASNRGAGDSLNETFHLVRSTLLSSPRASELALAGSPHSIGGTSRPSGRPTSLPSISYRDHRSGAAKGSGWQRHQQRRGSEPVLKALPVSCPAAQPESSERTRAVECGHRRCGC